MPVAFVAGATGYTGREVVRLLRARKIETIAHVRPDSSKLAAFTERWGRIGVSVDTTPWTPEALAATFGRLQPDVVFGLLGTTQARASKEAKAGVPKAQNSYERVDYGMTHMLIEALAPLPAPRRFVYLSAAGASATGNAYMRARGRIEEELAASSIQWVSARPSWITGTDREESRPAERIGASLSDVALGVAGL